MITVVSGSAVYMTVTFVFQIWNDNENIYINFYPLQKMSWRRSRVVVTARTVRVLDHRGVSHANRMLRLNLEAPTSIVGPQDSHPVLSFGTVSYTPRLPPGIYSTCLEHNVTRQTQESRDSLSPPSLFASTRPKNPQKWRPRSL